jgi:hypothetical protein
MNTNEISSLIGKAVTVSTQMFGLPSPVLVGLTCIVIGYLLKRWPRFPNSLIPHAVVIWAMLFTLVLSGNCPPNLTVPQWRVTNALVGMVFGFAAWAGHYWIISRWFPGLDAKLSGDDPAPVPMVFPVAKSPDVK